MHTRNSDDNVQLVGAFETRLEDTVNRLTSNVFFPSTAPPSIEGRCGGRPKPNPTRFNKYDLDSNSDFAQRCAA